MKALIQTEYNFVLYNIYHIFYYNILTL